MPLEFDLECVVKDGGVSSQAGAIRLATAVALQSFVDKPVIEKMRLAGLLSFDPRVRERKKYGQKGARAKYTWYVIGRTLQLIIIDFNCGHTRFSTTC